MNCGFEWSDFRSIKLSDAEIVSILPGLKKESDSQRE